MARAAEVAAAAWRVCDEAAAAAAVAVPAAAAAAAAGGASGRLRVHVRGVCIECAPQGGSRGYLRPRSLKVPAVGGGSASPPPPPPPPPVLHFARTAAPPATGLPPRTSAPPAAGPAPTRRLRFTTREEAALEAARAAAPPFVIGAAEGPGAGFTAPRSHRLDERRAAGPLHFEPRESSEDGGGGGGGGDAAPPSPAGAFKLRGL